MKEFKLIDLVRPLKNRSFLTFLFCIGLFTAMNIHGQDTGAAEITSKIQDWANGIQTSLQAAVGILAFVGGFIVFVQYMQGDSSAQGNFIKLLIGIAIFGLMIFIVNLFIPNSITAVNGA